MWQDIKVDGETKSRIEYSTEWAWEVKKDFWQNRDSVRIIATPVIGERFAFGWGMCNRVGDDKGNDHNGKSQTIDVSMPTDLGDLAPAHLHVSKGSFAPNPNGETLSFTLLCNSNWTVESNADWCVISETGKSGADTGANERQILFNVAKHPQAGGDFSVRQAKITVKEIRPNGKIGDSFDIDIQQATK